MSNDVQWCDDICWWSSIAVQKNLVTGVMHEERSRKTLELWLMAMVRWLKLPCG